MTTARYKQHIIAKLAPVGQDVRILVKECNSKTEIREVLRRHNLLAPRCRAIMRAFISRMGKQSSTRCGKAVTVWWDHDLGVPVCRTCAAKLNASGTQRCTKVPSKKRNLS